MKSRLHILCLLLMVPLLVHAEIYRWVDEDGKTVYSDRPRQGASKVDLPPLTTYKPEQTPAATSNGNNNSAKQAKGIYKSFRISSPRKEQTIHGDSGFVTVIMQVTPALRPGDEILLKMDNEVLKTQSLTHTYQYVDRGTHTVSANVIDSQGNTLISADPVVFYVRRHSILQPKPKAKPPAAP